MSGRQVTDDELRDLVQGWPGSLTGLHDRLRADGIGVGAKRLRRVWLAQGRYVREQWRRS